MVSVNFFVIQKSVLRQSHGGLKHLLYFLKRIFKMGHFKGTAWELSSKVNPKPL